jgi:hypothetical protein
LKIVPERSACIDGFRVKTASIPKNHSDMCKYENRNEIGYQRTSDYILDLLDKAQDKKAESMSLPVGAASSGQTVPQAINAKPDTLVGGLPVAQLESNYQDLQEALRK